MTATGDPELNWVGARGMEEEKGCLILLSADWLEELHRGLVV